MKTSEPGQGELGQLAVEMGRLIASLRQDNPSVLVYGFPRVVRHTLEKHLWEWFTCKLLDNTEDIEPDIVIAEEGNDEAAGDVEKLSEQYGTRAVLMSIASTLAKSMRPMSEHRVLERCACPIGPSSLGKFLGDTSQITTTSHPWK